jgi:hypothetical protein
MYIGLNKNLYRLKVVGNEKQGVGKEAKVRIGAIEVCLSCNFAVVSNFNALPFPPSKSKFIGDVLMNRQKASNMYLFLFSFITCSAY